MKRIVSTAATLTLALVLAACGGGEQNASNDMAMNEATASDMNMMADANNPFAQSEMQMSERMVSAVGVDVGDTWVRKMIEHHQGAIDMSRLMLQQGPPTDIAKMAQDTITKQEKEIANLRKLVKDGSPNQQSAEPYKSAEKQMHDAMMAARGSNVAETFMRKMLEHHRGGVALSDVALNNGVAGQVRAHAQKTRTSQHEEAEMVEAMLSGQSYSQAMAASGTKTVQGTRAEPAPPAKPATSPTAQASQRPAKPSAPRAESKPAPTPAPEVKPATTACAPEHRAAGHC